MPGFRSTAGHAPSQYRLGGRAFHDVSCFTQLPTIERGHAVATRPTHCKTGPSIWDRTIRNSNAFRIHSQTNDHARAATAGASPVARTVARNGSRLSGLSDAWGAKTHRTRRCTGAHFLQVQRNDADGMRAIRDYGHSPRVSANGDRAIPSRQLEYNYGKKTIPAGFGLGT